MQRIQNERPTLGWLSLALAAWLFAAATATAQGLPKAEQILDKYIEATGGKAAHEKITSSVSHGKMEIGGANLKGPATMYHAAPNKLMVVIELEGLGKIEQGTDGKVAWEKNALTGTRVITGEEKAAFLRRADIHGDLNWRKQYKKVETVAEEKVEDKPAYKVVMTPPEGAPESRYFDKESGLLVKVATTVKTPMGEVPTESFVSDYRKVDGILTPHKVRQMVLVQELTITVDKIENNVKIPDSRFAVPDDVKKLLDK